MIPFDKGLKNLLNRAFGAEFEKQQILSWLTDTSEWRCFGKMNPARLCEMSFDYREVRGRGNQLGVYC